MRNKYFSKIFIILTLLSAVLFSNTYLVQALELPNVNNYQISAKKSVTVYVTNTGSKYHKGTCRYLKKSKIAMKLSEAKKYYDPCKVCKPPR